jgi:hypothetical protein
VDVSISLTHCTADCSEAVLQAVNAFNTALALETKGIVSPAVRRVVVSLEIWNPLSNVDGGSRRGTFDLSTGTYFGVAALDHADWVAPDWAARMAALAAAARSALGPTKRMGKDERVAIAMAADRAAIQAAQNPPEVLAALASVHLVFSGDQMIPGVSFGVQELPPSELSRLIEVPPEQARQTAARYFGKATDAPSMFKSYRAEGANLGYREAWVDGDFVVEHWGTCGERGSTRRHEAADNAKRREVLAALSASAEQDGYRSIAIADHGTIVARRPTVEARWEADLELRYELQKVLDDELGWTGLGHCDGGSTGGGSMEVFCYVVDINAGLSVVNRQLADPRFRGFVAVTPR